MTRLWALVALVAVAVVAAAWLSGFDRVVQVWALEGQRAAQTAIAGAIRALRAGDPAALWGFVAVCFAYGFFHAAGPGHGKLVIGGYGAARAVGPLRLSAVALASSVAQGLSAVALVGLGLWVWRIGRARMTELADAWLAPASFAAIALVGLWLMARGARGLVRAARGHGHPRAGRGHDHEPQPPGAAVCGHCGHAHAPDPTALAQATGWREIAALVGAVAIRPCTGAVFVMILTAQGGLFWVGVAGVMAMALGTASVTVAVAVAAVTLRRGALAGLSGSAALARAGMVLELSVGGLIAVLATRLALAAM